MINAYLQDILRGQLNKLGLTQAQCRVVLADVKTRLESALAHWNDESFRRSILTIGREEATFWQPQTSDIEVRSLVVITIRNSLITDLNASGAFTPCLRSKKMILPDEIMPLITSHAIKYFQAQPLNNFHGKAKVDLFGSLPKRFPNAWTVFSLLGNTLADEIDYKLEGKEAESISFSDQMKINESLSICESGIEPHPNNLLAGFLEAVKNGEAEGLITPSFKHITRNPEVLFSVIDHMLRYGGYVLTPNYLITPTYLARRSQLLRPCHYNDEFEGKMADHSGVVSEKHREALRSYENRERNE